MAQNSQVSISTTATQVLAANGNRLAYSITNITGLTVYFGNSNLVTAANGSFLPTGSVRNIAGDAQDVWAILAAGGPVVLSVVEELRLY